MDESLKSALVKVRKAVRAEYPDLPACPFREIEFYGSSESPGYRSFSFRSEVNQEVVGRFEYYSTREKMFENYGVFKNSGDEIEVFSLVGTPQTFQVLWDRAELGEILILEKHHRWGLPKTMELLLSGKHLATLFYDLNPPDRSQRISIHGGPELRLKIYRETSVLKFLLLTPFDVLFMWWWRRWRYFRRSNDFVIPKDWPALEQNEQVMLFALSCLIRADFAFNSGS